MDMQRNLIFAAASLAFVVGVGVFVWPGDKSETRGASAAGAGNPEILVYKGPQCDCCEKWADHLQAAGFEVRVEEVSDLSRIKAKYGIRPHLETCHTAVVDGYVIEGHVPAASVKRLLEERPRIAGIVVPGMPIGSPGMEEGPVEGYVHYSVLTFDSEGRTAIYDRY